MHKYINLRGEYGFSQTYTMDYCSIQDVLDQMDRLGIWQTVVEFTGASNTLYRAKRLLNELNDVPNWRQRVIPCFMSDPQFCSTPVHWRNSNRSCRKILPAV